VKDCGPNGCSNHPAVQCTRCDFKTWRYIKDAGAGYQIWHCAGCGEPLHYSPSKNDHWCSKTIAPKATFNKDTAIPGGSRVPEASLLKKVPETCCLSCTYYVADGLPGGEPEFCRVSFRRVQHPDTFKCTSHEPFKARPAASKPKARMRLF